MLVPFYFKRFTNYVLWILNFNNHGSRTTCPNIYVFFSVYLIEILSKSFTESGQYKEICGHLCNDDPYLHCAWNSHDYKTFQDNCARLSFSCHMKESKIQDVIPSFQDSLKAFLPAFVPVHEGPCAMWDL